MDGDILESIKIAKRNFGMNEELDLNLVDLASKPIGSFWKHGNLNL